MSYGVVVCSRCRKAKVFEEGRKTTQCAGCGRALRLAELTVHHRSGDAASARQAAGLLNAQLAGASEEFAEAMFAAEGAETPEPQDSTARAARRARSARGEMGKAEAAARALGEFTPDAFEAVLGDAGMSSERALALLDRLVNARVVYEPRAGWFRVL